MFARHGNVLQVKIIVTKLLLCEGNELPDCAELLRKLLEANRGLKHDNYNCWLQSATCLVGRTKERRQRKRSERERKENEIELKIKPKRKTNKNKG
jgi:hypothetical protein